MWFRYSYRKNCWTICKQWKPWSDAAFCGVWSGSALFATFPLRGFPFFSAFFGSKGNLLDFYFAGLVCHKIPYIGLRLRWRASGPNIGSVHYENTPIQIHWRFYYKKKMAIFQIKNSDIFYISAQNIDCGYSLEPPRRGGSNEYPQSMFLSRNKKNNVYPCKPRFYYIKMGFEGVKII